MVYSQKGMHQEAISAFEKAVRLSNEAPHLMALLGATYEKAGDRSSAQNILEKLKRLLSEKRAQPGDMAIIYIGLGDKERAFEWLEKAYLERSWVVRDVKSEPFFDPLRSDPRFEDLVRRVDGKH